MRRIYKYHLTIKDIQTITAPANWKPLSIQIQGSQIVMWALVYPGLGDVPHTIVCVSTGHDIQIGHINPDKYIGTVQDNVLVWHFFEQDH